MKKKKKDEQVDKYLDKFVEQIKHFEKETELEKPSAKLLVEIRYLYSLLEITRSINIPRDFSQLLELIVDAAIDLTKAERGFLMLFGKDGTLEFRVTRNIDKETLEGEEFEISRTVVNQVLAIGKSLFLSDIYKDQKFKVSESIEALGLRMVMCVPLKARDRLLGLIYVDSRSETESFRQFEEKLFEAFAAQASVALENSHLYDSSVHDALTGLYNYGYLRTRIEEEINRAHRYRKDSLAFIMLDLDNFKKINDSHGHLFGNSVLVKVADLIKNNVRKSDIPARYGGDEFAILMPNADVQHAQALARRLQKEMASLKFSVGKKTLSITSSIGISIFPFDKITDSENIIIEADHALFIAKGKGGNQVAAFGVRRDEEKHGPELIGKSTAMSEVRKLISKFAGTNATVLIIGETGTGKELITHLLQKQSTRADKPFVVVNCGSIPASLLERELFGYEKGAFTGAYRQHKGKFEVAHGGTIFLDEIGDLPLQLQAKLLRAIDQKEIDRIGGKSPVKVDVRMIVATNKNIEKEVTAGNFRKDLYYHLSIASIIVPPLRERSDDIEDLSTYYLKEMNKRYHRKFVGFTKGAMEAMRHHLWPGNVRELVHRIERAVIMGMGGYLRENDLGLALLELEGMNLLKQSRDKAERDTIIQVLNRNQWNIAHSSQELGISRKTLRDLIKKHKIIKP